MCVCVCVCVCVCEREREREREIKLIIMHYGSMDGVQSISDAIPLSISDCPMCWRD